MLLPGPEVLADCVLPPRVQHPRMRDMIGTARVSAVVVFSPAARIAAW
jgi:hypothetical protein